MTNSYETHAWTKDDFKKLAEVSKIKNISKSNRVAIQKASEIYAINRQSEFPRWRTTKKQLVDLKDSIDPLASSIAKMDDLSKQLIAMANSAQYKGIKNIYAIFENIPKDLTILKRSVEGALKNVKPDKRGRPRETALNALFGILARIFYGITGTRPTISCDYPNDQYKGKFLSFVETFLSITGCSRDI